MKMSRVKLWVILVAGSLLLAGCAYYRPSKEVGTSQEIEGKPGGGLFTGKSGEWVIFSR